MITGDVGEGSSHPESFEHEKSQEILREIIREFGKDVGKELGKTVSLKDLVKAFKPDIINGIVKHYVETLIRDAQSCRTSYCVAMKLSSMYSQLDDIGEIIEIQPNELLKRILFDPSVINVACGWPIDSILSELDLVQFTNLRQAKSIISNWLQIVNSTGPCVEKKEVPVSVSSITHRTPPTTIISQSKPPTENETIASFTNTTSISSVNTTSTAETTSTIEVKREGLGQSQHKEGTSDRDYIVTLIGVLIGLILILLSLVIP